MSEQMKTAGESLGQDIVSEDAESAVGEVAANQGVETAGNAEAVAAGVDEEPEGEAADEPTEEELAAARELAENNALADVFDDVRKQSADSHLVTPERWPEIGLVPEHMTAEDFEMFVYEWLEDYQAEHKEEIEAERAAERAKAAAVRSATRAVGVPPKIPNRRLEQIEADNEAKATEAADKAPEAVEDSAEAESAAGVDASVQVDDAAESAESAAVAATPAASEPAPGSPDSAAEDEQPAEDDRSPFAGLRIPEGYRLEQIEGEWVLVEDENAAPVRKEIKDVYKRQVILCTLLLANFVVPLLAPKEQADERDEQAVNAAHIEILKRVIRQVREQKTPTNEAATQIVVRQYSERIKRLRRKNTSAPCLLELRATAIEQQKAQVDKYIREGRISRAEGEREIERLESSRRTLLRAHTRRQALGEVWSLSLIHI